MDENLTAAIDCRSSFLVRKRNRMETNLIFNTSQVSHFSEFTTKIDDLRVREGIQPFLGFSSQIENQCTTIELEEDSSQVFDC